MCFFRSTIFHVSFREGTEYCTSNSKNKGNRFLQASHHPSNPSDRATHGHGRAMCCETAIGTGVRCIHHHAPSKCTCFKLLGTTPCFGGCSNKDPCSAKLEQAFFAYPIPSVSPCSVRSQFRSPPIEGWLGPRFQDPCGTSLSTECTRIGDLSSLFCGGPLGLQGRFWNPPPSPRLAVCLTSPWQVCPAVRSTKAEATAAHSDSGCRWLGLKTKGAVFDGCRPHEGFFQKPKKRDGWGGGGQAAETYTP